jgi:hypothetical protein
VFGQKGHVNSFPTQRDKYADWIGTSFVVVVGDDGGTAMLKQGIIDALVVKCNLVGIPLSPPRGQQEEEAHGYYPDKKATNFKLAGSKDLLL